MGYKKSLYENISNNQTKGKKKKELRFAAVLSGELLLLRQDNKG